jgi:hypothetical protein
MTYPSAMEARARGADDSLSLTAASRRRRARFSGDVDESKEARAPAGRRLTRKRCRWPLIEEARHGRSFLFSGLPGLQRNQSLTSLLRVEHVKKQCVQLQVGGWGCCKWSRMQ